MSKLITSIEQFTMTSNDIAKNVGKLHNKIMQDIRNIIDDFNCEQMGFLFKKSTYQGERRKEKCIAMNKAAYNFIINRYEIKAQIPTRLQEEASLKTIEQLLNITLIRQYKVLNYRIDGYDPISNVAYEIDEPEHRYSQEKDKKRQNEIENKLNCKFVRIKL